MKSSGFFIDDLYFPGMIYALTIRSPVSKGFLAGMICPELPESYFLIKANDFVKNELADFHIPILVNENLEYIGQPVAILAGPVKSVLEEIANKIYIDTNDEQPNFSMEIISDEDILVKRDISSEKIYTDYFETVISGSYATGIQDHWYSEPCGALALPGDDGITIFTASQWPFHVRHSVAAALCWNHNKINVEATNPALSLDGKIWYPSLLACHAALAAKLSGRPVKLILNREEDFLYTPKRNKSRIFIQSSLKEDSIHNTDISLSLDLGSRGIFEEEIIDQTCLGALGVYRHGSYNIKGQGIRTNVPPQGPMTGFGMSQGFFAIERHVSLIADTLGQDPAQWRKNNFLTDNRFAIGSNIKTKIPLPQLIDRAAAIGDYYRKWASYELLRKRRKEDKWEDQFSSKREPLRGIGISTAFQGSGFLHNDISGNGNCTVELCLEKDGSLKIKSSLAYTGTGSFDSWKKLAKDILSVEPELLEIVSSTRDAPDSGAGSLSRNIVHVTGLVERCCNTIRSLRFREPLPITVKRSIKTVKAAGWNNDKINLEAFSNPGWGAAVTEVEIDPDSFIPYVRGIWMAIEGGRILSTDRAKLTVEQGIMQALGWASREQIHYTDGEINNVLLRRYDIPAPSELPPMYVDFLSSNETASRGIGELPFHCVPASYAQALSQAMDHHFDKIPLDARDIWTAANLKKEHIQ